MTAELPVREGNAGLPSLATSGSGGATPSSTRSTPLVLGLRRRRHRRPAGIRRASLHRRPRRRRDLAVAVLPLAPARRRLRRRRPRATSTRAWAPSTTRARWSPQAHALGLRVFVDVVPNHFSWDHPLVQWPAMDRARLAGVGALPALRGKGENGELPPNNWVSAFRRVGVDADRGL